MRLFIIHRFKDNKIARRMLKQLSKNLSLQLKPIFLDSSVGDRWKVAAEQAIYESEAVIIFNPESCYESENAKWEIEKAKVAQKEIIEFHQNGENQAGIARLISVYDFKDEFEMCFSSSENDKFELYRIMIDSSEQLIQRRQVTNAFFITVIGSLLAFAGLLVQTGTINGDALWILYVFLVIGLLLCNSWRNLIDNYGKLNKAKFDVILRLESDLSARIYSAEWIALGKGLRPNKYKSFTSTEKNVPFYFGLLIIVLMVILVAWHISRYF